MPRRMYWRFTRWERDRSSAWSRSWRPRRRASRPGSPNPASRPAWHRACRTFGAHVGLQRTSLPLWRDRRSQDAAMRVSDGCSDRLRLVGCDHRAGLAVDAPRKPPGTSTVASLRCLRGAAAWMLGAASARVRSATRHWKQMRSHLWQVSKLLPLCSTCPPVPPPPGTGDKFASPWGHIIMPSPASYDAGLLFCPRWTTPRAKRISSRPASATSHRAVTGPRSWVSWRSVKG